MKEIATIGFGKKGAERFVTLLEEAGVTTVIDTRRRADSPLSGYARKRDLPFLLARAAGIGYEHRLELAPPDDLLQRYRSDHDWNAYVRDYELVLQSDDGYSTMLALARRSDTVAILCSEPAPDRCHRKLVTDRMCELFGPLSVVHLV